MKFRMILPITAIALLVSGCSIADPSTLPTLQGIPATVVVGEQPQTQAPYAAPTFSVQVCPIPPGSPDLPNLNDPHTWAADILAYLNAGGFVSSLLDHIQASNSIEPSAKVGEILDLNGDGFEDLALILIQAPSELTPMPSGSLLIFLCAEETFRVVYVTSPASEAGRPKLQAARDFTGDGRPELLTLWESCGAHTCFAQAEILKWDGSGFENVWQGRSNDLPSPDIELQGPLADGSTAIAITARGIGSAGAGPYREIQRTWTWHAESGRFEVSGEALADPKYRIHVLHDADQAALEGDYETAAIGYLRVMEDGTLDDWSSGEDGRAALRAYAAFRLIVINVRIGNTANAEAGMLFLQAAYPPESPHHAYAELAENFWEAYQISGDPGEACLAAQRYALNNPEAVLEPLYYGYANRTYLAVDICPLDS
ncbi:MAG: hypothetical protein E3J30_11015 [Anaerolineales bacterium]|nr:MAG: hypothetical protein E3J30_11015 [Anaerolineales bacterium]